MRHACVTPQTMMQVCWARHGTARPQARTVFKTFACRLRLFTVCWALRTTGPRPFVADILSLQVPHGLALVESLDLLCIADRENMRVVCLQPYMSAQPVSIQAPDLGRVFGVAAAGEWQCTHAHAHTQCPVKCCVQLGTTFPSDAGIAGVTPGTVQCCHLHFAHTVHLRVSNDSKNKQYWPADHCTMECFLRGMDWKFK
jgi:hypothetical protein